MLTTWVKAQVISDIHNLHRQGRMVVRVPRRMDRRSARRIRVFMVVEAHSSFH